MNIFATSQCPIQCAQEMTNVHVVKMILESAQLLSTAHFVLDGAQVGYKPTHQNHPCAIWARETSANYNWLYRHLTALCNEFTFRTGKTHKTSEQLWALADFPLQIKIGTLTPFALCMPEEFARLGLFDQTLAYQGYLNVKFAEWRSRDKPIKVEWTNRPTPSWAV
jgi:hypothetical protein